MTFWQGQRCCVLNTANILVGQMLQPELSFHIKTSYKLTLCWCKAISGQTSPHQKKKSLKKHCHYHEIHAYDECRKTFLLQLYNNYLRFLTLYHVMSDFTLDIVFNFNFLQPLRLQQITCPKLWLTYFGLGLD